MLNVNRRFADGFGSALFLQGVVPAANVSGGTIVTSQRFPTGNFTIEYGGALTLAPGQSWTSAWDYKTSGEATFRFIWWEEPAP